MDDQQEEFRRQLEFIIKQLNKPSEEDEVFPDEDSDDEGDEDDDEVRMEKCFPFQPSLLLRIFIKHFP